VQANDRDWNHVNDWWPRGKDLYTMTSVTTPNSPTEVELIERSLKEAQK
jgi:hypothetical protein